MHLRLMTKEKRNFGKAVYWADKRWKLCYTYENMVNWQFSTFNTPYDFQSIMQYEKIPALWSTQDLVCTYEKQLSYLHADNKVANQHTWHK